MTDVPLDVVGNEIKAGDWIVQAFNLGRCAAIKVAYVTETISNARFRAVHFSSDEGGEWVDDTTQPTQYGRYPRIWVPDGVITWDRSKPYIVTYADRSFVIDKNQVPKDVLEYIENELGGDPMAAMPEAV